jgi:hypothetical protein
MSFIDIIKGYSDRRLLEFKDNRDFWVEEWGRCYFKARRELRDVCEELYRRGILKEIGGEEDVLHSAVRRASGGLLPIGEGADQVSKDVDLTLPEDQGPLR